MSKQVIPKIGSTEFKKLGFKEQLTIFSLYLSEPNKYVELTGGVPSNDELSYINNEVDFIKSQPNLGIPPPKDLPIFSVENQWACYLAYYNTAWFEAGLSPLDYLEIKHHRIFNTQLFTFPLLVLDYIGYAIVSWLSVNKPYDTQDMMFYIVKLRATAEYFFDQKDLEYLAKCSSDKDTHPILRDIWNTSVSELIGLTTISSINGKYPIVEESETTDLVDDNTLIISYPNIKYVDRLRSFIPLVPRELVGHSKFSIKGWDFLEVAS